MCSKMGWAEPGRRPRPLGNQAGSAQCDRLVNALVCLQACVLIVEADNLKYQVHLICVNFLILGSN